MSRRLQFAGSRFGGVQYVAGDVARPAFNRIAFDDEGHAVDLVRCDQVDDRLARGGRVGHALKAELAEIIMKPSAEAQLKGPEAARMRELVDALENLDDVQDVYTTAVID